MDTGWHLMDTRWTPDGTRWTPNGHPMDTRWPPYGIRWTPDGHSMDTQWTPDGHPMDTRWTPYAPPIDILLTILITAQSVMIFKTCKISWLDPTILYQAQKLDSENYLRCEKWESLRFCSQNGHIITFEGKSFSRVSYKPFCFMCKWNSQTKTSNCGVFEDK